MDEPTKNDSTLDQSSDLDSATVSQAPVDALSQEPEVADDVQPEAGPAQSKSDKKVLKKSQPSKLKKLFKAINIYLLLFILLILVAGAFAVVNYLNSKKVVAPEPNIANQTLSPESLEELAKTDVSVGAKNQTFTIKGNADINGQSLVRGNLNVAGTMQSAGALTTPDLTVSGRTNLRDTQAQSLRVANSITIQGDTSVQKLNVSGSSSFQGPMTAAKITTANLVLSGNAVLSVPNHISFTGPTPSRSVKAGLGAGGSVSISGSDSAGSLNLNTGNGPSASCLVRVNFNQAFKTTPRVIISPVGAAAGRLDFYVNRDSSGFEICSANQPSANARFSFDYFITN